MVTARLEFGEWLRRQRERRGISLAAIADQTKISASLFAALEKGDCSRWPSGIYSRAWIRNYALTIGLDPDDVGERFSTCFAQTAFPDPEPQPVESRAQRLVRRLRAFFERRTDDADRNVPVAESLVAPDVRRKHPKRVVTRRKGRRVQRSIRRDALA